MSEQPFTSPVADSVPKIDFDVAVGEDLDFQRKWWVFERIIWAFFAFVILCDLLGILGRGALAKAEASLPDRSLVVNYERIERASTPSTMTLHFGAGAIRGGRIEVYVSDSVVKELGAQRIAPQPAVSAVGGGGVTYRFPATASPALVQIQLEPALAGRHHFRVQVPGKPPIDANVIVLP